MSTRYIVAQLSCYRVVFIIKLISFCRRRTACLFLVYLFLFLFACNATLATFRVCVCVLFQKERSIKLDLFLSFARLSCEVELLCYRSNLWLVRRLVRDLIRDISMRLGHSSLIDDADAAPLAFTFRSPPITSSRIISNSLIKLASFERSNDLLLSKMCTLNYLFSNQFSACFWLKLFSTSHEDVERSLCEALLNLKGSSVVSITSISFAFSSFKPDTLRCSVSERCE